MTLPTFIARRDPKMRARIVSDRQLVYDGEPSPLMERPRHVRAGSGLAWTGDRMVVVQDDADYIAVIEGDGVRLFHRGNRPAPAASKVKRHLSATVDFRLDSLPAYLERTKRDPKACLRFDLVNPRRYDLDQYEGTPFTFTDASAVPGTPQVAFVAVAERGEECVATAVGVVDPDGQTRYTILV